MTAQDDQARGDTTGHAEDSPTAPANEVAPASDEECSVLRHMLGIDTPDVAHPKPYRNYYCADPENPQLQAMERKGLVECYSRRGGYDWYRCTDAGRTAAFRSHKVIVYPKKKRVYLRFLHLSDVCPDLTFKEYLTSEHFAEDRRNA